jgi:hypothetical protein
VASTRTETKIRYNKWRGGDEGEGEGTKDELAATIRLWIKVCTRGGGKQKPPKNQPKKKRETSDK